VWYDKSSIDILFTIISVSLSSGCMPPRSVPVTVKLDEKLGNRYLHDEGARGIVFQWSRVVSVYRTDPLGELASDRARALVGPDVCESVVEGDRAPLARDQLLALAAQVQGGRGPADHGLAYVGNWLDAAQYFGAVEAYTDGYIYYGILAPASNLGIADPTADGSALAITRLNRWSLIGAGDIWYPAFEFDSFLGARVFHAPPCEAV
jgi:hypothetical protein